MNNNNNTEENEGGEGNGGGSKNTGASSNSGGSGDEAGASATVGGSSGTEAGSGNVEGGSTGVVGGATNSEGGGSEAEGGAGGSPAVCDDSVGTPTCENVSENCTPYCAAAIANLKPAAAVAAIACLEADETCNDGYKCLADATAQGCAEDVETNCTAAMTTCGEPDPGDPACSQLLSGFTDEVRAEVVTCISDESCFSVYSCAEGFFFSSE